MSCQGHPARQRRALVNSCSCHTFGEAVQLLSVAAKQMLQCASAADCYKRLEAEPHVQNAAKLTSFISSSDADASASSSLIQSGA